MRDYDELPYIVIERHNHGIAPFFWGALLGAAAALLLAPRAGSETQQEIRDGVRRVRTAAEDGVEKARSRVTQTRDRLQQRVDAVRGEIDTRTDQARNAMDQGRRAAREAREELERRVSDVKDSYQSVTDKVGLRGDETLNDIMDDRGMKGGSDLG